MSQRNKALKDRIVIFEMNNNKKGTSGSLDRKALPPKPVVQKDVVQKLSNHR